MPPKGELWREVAQVGKETTYGTAVVATRKIYGRDLALGRERAARVHQFATGSRSNVRKQTLGAVEAGGKVSMPASADESIEFWLCAVQGGVSPTTPAGGTAARQWTFTDNETLDSMTIERLDGARLWKATGVRVDGWSLKGSVAGDNVLTFDLFAKERTSLAALATGLAERVPTFMEGWEARLYLDALGATPRTTLIAGTLVNWEIQAKNNLKRSYAADNTLAAKEVLPGETELTGKLTFLADVSQAGTEYDNWEAETERLIGLEFGRNKQIEASPVNEVQTVTISGSPTGGTFTLTFRGQTTGTIAYNATAATVQTALEALPSINPGNVTVTGGPGPATPYTVTFTGQLGGLDVAQMTAAHAFTGGASPSIAVSTTTAGVGHKRTLLLDIPCAWSAVEVNATDNDLRVYEFAFQYIFDATNNFGYRVTCINSRTTAFA